MARREKVAKTNAMRELEEAGVSFESVTYEVDEEDTSSELGLHIAEALGDDPASSFKTLVCTSSSGGHVVCCSCRRRARPQEGGSGGGGEVARAHARPRPRAHDRLRARRLLARGHEEALSHPRRRDGPQLFDLIHISGGRRGLSLVLAPDDLVAFCEATYADITREGM